jgi:hypothetical protein
MIAIAYFFALCVYLALAFFVTRAAVRAARRRGISGWKWGVPVALALYLVVFWDHVPTLLLHEYKCAKEMRLDVVMTPEEWRRKNPDEEVRPFVGKSSFYASREAAGFWLNQRFANIRWVEQLPILPVRVVHEAVIDMKGNIVVVENVSVTSGYSVFGSGDGWNAMKFWMGRKTCSEPWSGFRALEKQYRLLAGGI